MSAALGVCAVLALLPLSSALCAGLTDSCRVQGRTSDVSCSGQHGADSVTCIISRETGDARSSRRLRLTALGDRLATRLSDGATLAVHRLTLTDSSLVSLPNTMFSGLSSTKLLQLDNNLLRAVPTAALRQLPCLRTLAINHNRIRRLGGSHLEPVPCLTYLSLASNGLSRLDRGALPASLKQVGLWDNQLHTLNGTVRGLANMQWLMVSRNRLTSLRDQLPVGGRLGTLLAADNRLTSLDGVQDAAQLTRLNLSSNRLRSLGRLRLPKLSELLLSHNQIQQVLPEQLVGLPALTELTLDGNHLTELGPILDVLPALTKLNLSHNQLTSIAQLTSADQQTRTSHPLEELLVAANRLTTIGQLSLPRLRKLNLANNQLTQVSAFNFAGMPSLQELVLSGNRLERVGQLLEVLPSLTMADFSNNSITSVAPLRALERLPHENKPQLQHLHTLLLNNNRLKLLDVSLFRLPSLCVLDVRNNAVSRLRWHRYHGWHCSLPHRKLRAAGNPIRCEDALVRRSLKMAAQDFTLDVLLCTGGDGQP